MNNNGKMEKKCTCVFLYMQFNDYYSVFVINFGQDDGRVNVCILVYTCACMYMYMYLFTCNTLCIHVCALSAYIIFIFLQLLLLVQMVWASLLSLTFYWDVLNQ